MASVIAPFTRLDMSVDYTWDWTPVDAGSTYIELRGASFFGRFTGQFNVNVTASTVTGPASTFQFARNGVNLMTFDFSPGLDAAVVATYMDNGDRLQPALAHLLRGNDTVTGQSGLNDILRGYGGNDTLDGAGGRDTAFYDGPRANYSVGLVSNNFRVTDRAGTEGTDTLLSVERIKFSDSSVALDINGTAGSAYRLYRAAFDRAPDLPGLGFQINALDRGQALASVAANFVASPEFRSTYGSLDDRQFVTQLYANVLDRAPDAGGLTYHINNLAHGMQRGEVLMGFSESPENKAAVIGTIQNGIEYQF